jgi:predicted short-subunit dehydrogenase-like oxidoreductase (DUF2520 family)
MAKVTLIGSGKAASALGKALRAAGHEIIEVWSRHPNNAEALAGILKARPVQDLRSLDPVADVFLIAVKDDAIEAVAAQMQAAGRIVAHCSGIKSALLLKSASENYGVFYPFVSMTKDADTDFSSALLMIEGINAATAEALFALAGSISHHVKRVEEAQRQSLHLAAVFAHNFTNHMYTVAAQLLAEKSLSFDALKPLIAAHHAALQRSEPVSLQTGPAIRHDHSTIEVHLQLLHGHEDLKKLYELLTGSIQQWHKDKQ